MAVSSLLGRPLLPAPEVGARGPHLPFPLAAPRVTTPWTEASLVSPRPCVLEPLQTGQEALQSSLPALT